MDTLVSDIQAHLAEVSTTGKELDERLLERFDGQVSGVQPAMPTSRNGLRS